MSMEVTTIGRPNKHQHLDTLTSTCFWANVQTVFYCLEGSEHRNPDQISLQWHNLRPKCTEFGGIYNNLSNLHKCRSSNFDVFKATKDQYVKTTATRKAFPYLKPWLQKKKSSSLKRPKNVDGSHNNRTAEQTSTSIMSGWILNMNNLFVNR
uniref:Uncharacterized protein n=1 Tax=Lactuca sativa TaxID=4236 RepID=A0A9R1UVX7_LACSA|nr:hypothetical protein LSAT_V11C800389410 [Lactuca sativa]